MFINLMNSLQYRLCFSACLIPVIKNFCVIKQNDCHLQPVPQPGFGRTLTTWVYCFSLLLPMAASGLSLAEVSVSRYIILQPPGLLPPVRLQVQIPQGRLSSETIDSELVHQAWESLEIHESLVRGQLNECESQAHGRCPQGINLLLHPETSTYAYLPLIQFQNSDLVTSAKPDFFQSTLVFPEPDNSLHQPEAMAGWPGAQLTIVTRKPDQESTLLLPLPGGGRGSLPESDSWFGQDQNFKPWFGGGGMPSDLMLIMSGQLLYHSEYYNPTENPALQPAADDIVIVVTDQHGDETDRIILTPEQLASLSLSAEEADSLATLEQLKGAQLTLAVSREALDLLHNTCGEEVPGIISCMLKNPSTSAGANGRSESSSSAGSKRYSRHFSTLPSNYDGNGGDGGKDSDGLIHCSRCGRSFAKEDDLDQHIALAHSSFSQSGEATSVADSAVTADEILKMMDNFIEASGGSSTSTSLVQPPSQTETEGAAYVPPTPETTYSPSQQQALKVRLEAGDLSRVYRLVYDARSQYYNLGLALGFKPSDLDAIKINYSDAGESLLELLRTWLRKAGKNINWLTLITALKSKAVQLFDIARNIEEAITAPRITLDSPLIIDHFREVQDVSWNARSVYYNLGVGLFIHTATLDTIKRANKNNPDQCFNQLLQVWLKSGNATIRKLVDALKFAGEVYLAETLEEKYQQ